MKLSPADVLAFVEELHAAGLGHRVAWFGAIVRAVEGRRERDRKRKAEARGSPENVRGHSADKEGGISADNGRTEESRVGGRGGRSDPNISVRSQDPNENLNQQPTPIPLRQTGGSVDSVRTSPRNVRGQTDALDEREARVEQARRVLLRVFGEHFAKEENANDMWPGPGPNDKWVRHVAAGYLAKQDDMEAVAEEVISGFFADEWARKSRWQWVQLAKDPGRYRVTVKGRQGERAVAAYEAIAAKRDAAYARGDHAEGKALEPKVREAYERANGRAAG